ANQNIPVNAATGPLPFTVAGESPNLAVSSTSSNPVLVPASNIILAGSGQSRTVNVIAAANLTGTALITIPLADGAGNTASTTFLVPVGSMNRPPTLDALGNLSIDEDAAPQIISLTGISSGAEDEHQILTVTATSSNPGLVPDPVVNYSTPNSTGMLVLAPV